MLGNAGPWRGLMEPTRACARALAHEGVLAIMQKGAVVDPDGFKGPIRLVLLLKDGASAEAGGLSHKTRTSNESESE